MDMFEKNTWTRGIVYEYSCVIFLRCLYPSGVGGGVNLKGFCRRRSEIVSHCLITGTKESPGSYLNRNRLGLYDVTAVVEALGIVYKEGSALFVCTDLLLTACQASIRQQGAPYRTFKLVDSFLKIYRLLLSGIFMGVCRIAKSDCYFRHVFVCPSFRLSTWNNSAPAGRLIKK
jgi:hypothetical protein